jgi:putative acetyltransferase
MYEGIDVRESTPGDTPALMNLYPAAFPDEDLLPVLSELLGDQSLGLSLVAVHQGAVVGHIYFTDCAVPGNMGTVAILSPLAVMPALQRQGIGGALIREGIARLKKADVRMVCVLGDPAYYGRFGFEREEEIITPYPLPEEWRDAWRSICLREDEETLKGTLSVPEPWRRPERWSE